MCKSKGEGVACVSMYVGCAYSYLCQCVFMHAFLYLFVFVLNINVTRVKYNMGFSVDLP